MEVTRRRSLVERMIGAATLQIDVYEEVEHDTTATPQAAGVVAIVAVASGIGSLGDGVGALFAGLIAAFLGWLAWSAVTYFIGTRLFEGTATWGELLRTLGFAQAPGVLNIAGVIPILGALVNLVVAIWLLVCGIVAIRQALDFDTGKALITAFLGWLALIVVGFFMALIFGVPMAVLAG